MYLARVVGQVVCSQKVEALQGAKMLLVEPLNPDGKVSGTRHVAIDTAQAGEGDVVTCVGSREAALAHSPSFVPVDAAIIGIIDDVEASQGKLP